MSTFPERSTTTHSLVDGQAMSSGPFVASRTITVQSEAPPVGSAEVTNFPLFSPSTQRVGEAHETLKM